jgi:hypothetical protein
MKKFPQIIVILALTGAAMASSYAQEGGAVVSNAKLDMGSDPDSGGMTIIRTIPADLGDVSVVLPTWGAATLTSGATIQGSNDPITGNLTIANAATITAFPFSYGSEGIIYEGVPLDAAGAVGFGTVGALRLTPGSILTATAFSSSPLFLGEGSLTSIGANDYTGFDGVTLTAFPTIGTITEINEPITIPGNVVLTTANNLVVNSSPPSGTVTTNSVPEPSAVVLLASGLALLGRRRQRRVK